MIELTFAARVLRDASEEEQPVEVGGQPVDLHVHMVRPVRVRAELRFVADALARSMQAGSLAGIAHLAQESQAHVHNGTDGLKNGLEH